MYKDLVFPNNVVKKAVKRIFRNLKRDKILTVSKLFHCPQAKKKPETNIFPSKWTPSPLPIRKRATSKMSLTPSHPNSHILFLSVLSHLQQHILRRRLTICLLDLFLRHNCIIWRSDSHVFKIGPFSWPTPRAGNHRMPLKDN